MTDTQVTPPAWAGGPGGPSDFVPTQPYVCMGGDSLPRIAELYGHSGEWQAIAELNVGAWPDYNNLQPGLSLTVPAEWLPDTKPASSSTRSTTTTRSSTD